MFLLSNRQKTNFDAKVKRLYKHVCTGSAATHKRPDQDNHGGMAGELAFRPYDGWVYHTGFGVHAITQTNTQTLAKA